MDLEKRKYYIQKYEFTMMGFLIDEDQFEVSPAITRTFQIYETETKYKKNKYKGLVPPEPATYDLIFPVGQNEIEELFNYTLNLKLSSTENVSSFQVYLNGDYYGQDLEQIQVNSNDTILVIITKIDATKESSVVYIQNIV
jgi:hypothetical protein